MKIIALGVGFLTMVCVCFLGSFVHAQQKSRQLRGIEPYTPTKLEWLALELNAEGRQEFTWDSPFALTYVCIEKDDAILIYVWHLPQVNREAMNSAIDTARQLIEGKAKSRGWDWVTIKEKVTQKELGGARSKDLFP
jgi:hypothetical protein